jgi:hypothetical protein
VTRARRWRLVLALSLLPLVLLLIGRRIEADFGLSGRYYPRVDWQGDVTARTDREISTRSLDPLPRSFGRRPFSARWDGYLRINEPGRYVFQLISDDGSWLEIGGRGVIDNGGAHSAVLKQATVDLAEGDHPISVMFFQDAGGWQLDLLWAREGDQPAPLAAPWLTGAPLGRGRFVAARIFHAILPYAPFLWLAAASMALITAISALLRRLRLSDHLADRALQAILLLSLILNVGGIWWGLSARWAPDEILPSHVMEAITQRFSGGWFGPYPPAQYYILGLAYLPFLAAEWIVGGATPWPFHLLNRIVNLVMAIGILLAWYHSGRTFGGRIAGLAATALIAVLLPFVFYAKLANLDVPYLFWFSWAMLFYARIITTADAGAYAWFAVAGALAIASKDQAFGFFVVPALHVALLRYRHVMRTQAVSLDAALRDGVVPRAALAGLGTLVVAYNLPLNWSGFVDHVDLIRRNGSGQYRMVANTLEGQLTLLGYTMNQIRFAFGWPALLLACAGLCSALSHPSRRTRLWLLLPAVSYYVFFIAPTAIVFDRFMIGVCMLLLLITGCAIEDWMRAGVRARCAAALALSVVCAYSVARAISLNAMMASDSRYYIEQWMARELPREAVVAPIAPVSYLPRFDWRSRIDAEAADVPASVQYVVLNATYAERFAPSSAEGVLYARIRNGNEFSLVARHRATTMWPLSGDPVFADNGEDRFSNLDKVNPLIEVYKRK